MNPSEDFLEAYAELESAVRELMAGQFSDTCGMCTACCCRADICEEAASSAFLSLLLKRQGRVAADMDDRYGWLDLNGCSLEYGRPPVCHTYFCDELLARLADDETRHAIRVLGRLMECIGEDALNGWHLVEIMDSADLEKVDFDALFQRMEAAQAAFEAIGHFFETGRFDASDRELLDAIAVDET
jgi:hypothetical protein